MIVDLIKDNLIKDNLIKDNLDTIGIIKDKINWSKEITILEDHKILEVKKEEDIQIFGIYIMLCHRS